MVSTPSGGKRPIANDRDLAARDLEATVLAMREALELVQREAQDRLQATLAQAAAEAEQLRGMITALREELEEQRQRHLEAMQQQRQLAADEIRLLQATIQAMRDGQEAEGR